MSASTFKVVQEEFKAEQIQYVTKNKVHIIKIQEID